LKRIRTTIATCAVFFILGCATPHQITMQDGTIIQATDKPKYDKDSGFYEFKTPMGERMKLNKDEIRAISSLDG
jgi:hypothetical protein